MGAGSSIPIDDRPNSVGSYQIPAIAIMNNECILIQTLKNVVVKNAQKSIVLIPKSRYADSTTGAAWIMACGLSIHQIE